MVIEICANSAQSALNAQLGGAQRVELCAAMPEGGTTPSYGEIVVARNLINIKLHVIIRPRGGDFLYSPMEIEAMKHDIRMASQLGADGVVFGCLNRQGEVDKEVCRQLIEVSGDMSLTFHRAFDMCGDPFRALEDIIDLGFHRVLTSGCEATAWEGRELLKSLVAQFGDRIIIMPGSGVNEDNICALRDYTCANEFHLSAKSRVESEMEFRNPRASMGGAVVIDEYASEYSSVKRIKSIVEQVNI